MMLVVVALWISTVSILTTGSTAYVVHWPTTTKRTTSLTRQYLLHHTRDADLYEQLVGGERYSMIPIPNQMRETTLFVGNLCEFVHDVDLSALFGQALLSSSSSCEVRSQQYSVPAVVARKPNTSSLQYGFVCFRNASETEAAMDRFHEYVWRGKQLRVEPIRDSSQGGPVRIPEKLVRYVCGNNKRGNYNEHKEVKKRHPQRNQNPGRKRSQSHYQQQKQKRQPLRSDESALSEPLRQQLERAMKKGFLVLDDAPPNIQHRQKQPSTTTTLLLHHHRQWCETLRKPQIVVVKHQGHSVRDTLSVDLSPLCIPSSYLMTYQTDIVHEASRTGMELVDDDWLLEEDWHAGTSRIDHFVLDDCHWNTTLGRQLPNVGAFVGERCQAKRMAANLGRLWDIPVEQQQQPSKAKMRRMRRSRSGGHRRSW